jgi:hypothetical protein
MVTKSATVPNSVYEILKQITGEARIDVALPMALKDLVQLKTQALLEKIAAFEKKYGMSFDEFEKACQDGRVANPFSYDVEKDNWEWEASIVEHEDLQEMAQWLA